MITFKGFILQSGGGVMSPNKAKGLSLFLTAGLLILASWTSRGLAATPPPFAFGVVLVGPYNDRGWSEAHYTAGKFVEENVPGARMIWLDKLNPSDRKGTTLDQVVNDMVSKGARLIFTTSDDFKDETRKAAEKYKEVTFIHISGDDVWAGKAPPNLANFMGRMEYAKMIAGFAAALSTRTGKIGYLGPLINAETRRLAVAAYLGARYAWTNYLGRREKDLKFEVKWIGFWFHIPGVTLDPTKVANDFFNAGTDVLLSGIDTNEVLVQAGKKAREGLRVWAVPYDFKEACKEAPGVCLGVPYFNWGPGYLKIVKAWQVGAWKQTFEWEGPDWKNLNNPQTSAIGFLPGQALKGAALKKVEEFIKELADGRVVLFKGPLRFQDGTVFLKNGEKATDRQIWYLPQLLEGMTGHSR
jgi:simple sugar transport system substrate-binding protein